MLRKFKGLTIAEMMITILIIGIVATLALSTIKPYDKTYKWLYVRMYHSLETAVYNSMMTRNSMVADADLQGFPENSNDFCNMLKEYMNAASEDSAGGSIVPKCEQSRDLTIGATSFTENKIQLILSNGMRLWIASNSGSPYVLNETINGTSVNMKYYVVFADINGSRGPNLAQWDNSGNTFWDSNSKLVDIVAFVVTESSVVIPVGPPEIDTRYMQASAIYPPNDENDPEGTRSAPNTYYWAKHDAWGDSKAITEPMSLDFASRFPANSPFVVTYPVANTVNNSAGCTSQNNKISQCYVKIEDYN